VKLLEQAGCEVEVPLQSCCGQPAYNAGDEKDAAALAKNMIAASSRSIMFVVAVRLVWAPWSRCTIPGFLQGDAAWSARADRAGRKNA